MIKVYLKDAFKTLNEPVTQYRIKQLEQITNEKKRIEALKAESIFLESYSLFVKTRDIPKILVSKLGKPYLAKKTHYFNLSHSNLLFGCAWSLSEIGLDLEQIRDFDQRLVSVVLSNEEKDLLDKSVDKNTLFFEYWTAKEAYVKYYGLSVMTDLSRINKEGNQIIGPEGSLFFGTHLFNDYIVTVVTKEHDQIRFVHLD